MSGLKERLTLSPELPIPFLNADFIFRAIQVSFPYSSDSCCVHMWMCLHWTFLQPLDFMYWKKTSTAGDKTILTPKMRIWNTSSEKKLTDVYYIMTVKSDFK